ncbi:MAG: hypothetical protein AAF490_24510 [Chloroflexota bacterium]
MCNHMQYLAKVDEYRWVGVCEHGTVHLTWDNMVIFLGVSELRELGFELDVAIVEDNDFSKQIKILDEERFIQSEGFFDIWIGGYAVRLKPVDYLIFGSMISKALDSINFNMQLPPSSMAITVNAQIETGNEMFVETDLWFSKN